jgi:serine protease Do
MKNTPTRIISTLAVAALGVTAFTSAQDNTKDDNKPKANNPTELGSLLKRDESALPANGQLQMSYATVVENILPSVVTIFPSSPIDGGGEDFDPRDLEQIPPALRPFFFRHFGIPEESDPFEKQDPRRRNQPAPTPREDAPRQRGVGSGVIITADGYILTNNHVVEGADDIEVSVESNGSRKTYKAEIIGTDPLTDVGLIKIDATGLTPATIGNSKALRVGDVVLAAGAPMQLNLSVTQGIVSALGRSGMNVVNNGRMAGYEDFIQTDAAINPGNSGGPLVDALGRVIGINTAILSRTGMNGGIGFAIPIHMALNIVDDLLDDGEVQRGYLGVQITDLDLEKSEALGLKDQGGALVTMVGGDSPAEKAGIEPGDVIVNADGSRVDSSGRLRLMISAIKPGKAVPLEILRNGERITVNATLDELPAEALAANGPATMPRGKGPGKNTEIIPGLIAKELTPQLRKQSKIPDEIEGLLVEEVDPQSRAAAMGIQKGDVIQEINRTPVENLTDAKELVAGTQRTALLRVFRDGDSMLVMVGLDRKTK